MWIILLDHSESMGEPFSGDRDLGSRRIRDAESKIKLDAAKSVLLSEIERLEPDFRLLVLGFNSRAQLIYDGQAGRREEIRTALSLIPPDNGTDIAAALDAAIDYKSKTNSSTIPRIFLISDGKSDRVQAKRAARQCVFDHSMGIHFILIDPTEEGESFVRDVVEPVGGTWDIVQDSEALQRAAQNAARSYSQDAARAKEWAKRDEQEAAEIERTTSNREMVKFTAGYPGRVRPNTDYSLLVLVHLDSMLEEVDRRLSDLRGHFGLVPQESNAETTQRLPLGTIIEITPVVSNIAFTPIRQTLAWMGELEEVVFRLRYRPGSEPRTPSSGFVDITVDGLLIARIPIAIAIDVETTEIRPIRSSAEMIRRVFASYSRKDEAVVRACKAAYAALAIQLFIDKDNLLTGQKWRSTIRQRIADHDLFQLYWSTSAASSSEVANEWGIALAIAPERTVDFIQPLYWSRPMGMPPAQLAKFNFGFLDLSSFKIAPEQITTAPTTGHINGGDLQSVFPILSVVPDTIEDVSQLRKDLAQIVSWLEELIFVRYYPPATFLVDQHAVRSVKATLAPERPPEGLESDKVALEKSTELLQSLALAFHVGTILGEDSGSFSNRSTFFGIADEQSKADYEHFVRMAEYIFAGPVREFTKGKDVLGAAKESFEKVLQGVESDVVSGWDVLNLIEVLRKVAILGDRAEVDHIVASNNMKPFKSFDTKGSVALAAKLLQTQLPKLAAQYGVERFFGRPDLSSLRFASSLPHYVRSLCDLWLRFLDALAERRGNPTIEVGAAVSNDALDWLDSQIPNLHIRRRMQQSRPEDRKSVFSISLLDYKASVAFLSNVLARELDALPRVNIKLLTAMADTFGVFVPGNAAEAQKRLELTFLEAGWPKDATLPGQDKVLICLNTLRELRDNLLREASMDQSQKDGLAHRLATSVLVHEHFHSALMNGLDQQGRVSHGSRLAGEWETAISLNESLAAWTERHYFRDDTEMLSQIDAYIRNGEYPDWPYRGAEFIEDEYKQGGIPAVRRWMQFLRDDPENAQTEFNRDLAIARPTGLSVGA